MKIHSPTISTIVQSSDCLISFDTGYEFHYILQYVIHGYSWLLPILEFGCAKMIITKDHDWKDSIHIM